MGVVMDVMKDMRTGKNKRGQPSEEYPDGSTTGNDEEVKFAKICLKSEEERHDVEMKRIHEDHESKMRSLADQRKATVCQTTRVAKDPAGYCLSASNSDVHKKSVGQPGVESPDSSTTGNDEGLKFAKNRLKIEEERHQAEMKRIQEDHESKMRSLTDKGKAIVGQTTRVATDPAGHCLSISNSDVHKKSVGQPGEESPDSSTTGMDEGVKFAETRLKSEEEKHQAEMRRIQKDHESKMRSLEDEWKATVGQITSIFPNLADFEHNMMMGMTESYRIGKDPAGYCLFISNSDAHKESVDALALNFVKLGFHVSLHENISGKGMWNLLQDTARKRLQEYKCFVCFIAGKGTPRTIEGKDGRTIDLKKIISLFDPSRIPSLCAQPKLMFFQCDVSTYHVTNIWRNEENPAFAPPYQDALALCSTHQNFVEEFLRSLEDNREQKLEQMLGITSKKIAPTSDDMQCVVTVSTLQKDVYLHGRKEYK